MGVLPPPDGGKKSFTVGLSREALHESFLDSQAALLCQAVPSMHRPARVAEGASLRAPGELLQGAHPS